MLKPPFEVSVKPLPFERFEGLLGNEECSNAKQSAALVRQILKSRTIWNISSTEAGGGVAEMLQPLLGYALGQQIPVRWVILQADQHFFEITKRIHNGLHGSLGDGGLLGQVELGHYTAVSEANLDHFRKSIRSGDVVILHDPQTAGLAGGLKIIGAQVVWRCHIGHDSPNELVERSWTFLEPFLTHVDALCFTRSSFAPPWADPNKIHVIKPSIDPFSAKNQEMDAVTARAVVAHLGIVEDGQVMAAPMNFVRSNGTAGQIERHADILHAGPLPPVDKPLIVQVSRWDRLKDMVGVMRGFADYVAPQCDAFLALVGPNVHGVSDDPEGAIVFEQCIDIWRQLPHFRRNRVQLVTLPMTDVEENAAMVNAIQRFATIVVQKSLYEGFGLTVTEAMWKGKPVVASAVGGICDQITDGKNGMLIHDPTSLTEFGKALCQLLANPDLRKKLGEASRKTVRTDFLPTRHLLQYAELVLDLTK